MQIPDIIIAVDGFSATGKSTLAKKIAEVFSFLYLDSGALYRGVTLYARENGLISEEGVIRSDALKAVLDKGLDLYFSPDGTCLGGRNIEKEIRTMEVSGQVSPISAEPYVRAFVDEKLRGFAARGCVVMDGRDIGTAVFPDAGLKIFVTAAQEVRARRRYDELAAKGERPDMDAVMANLAERDYIDSHRETHPLRQAEDAFVIDNSEMTLQEEIAWVKGLIQGRFGILE